MTEFVSFIQLSVTIGIMLAYLFGLFVNWRVLAVLGDEPIYFNSFTS